jgi:hypothetical protein
LVVSDSISNGVVLYLGNGTGTFTYLTGLGGLGAYGAGPGWAVVADVNRDGIPDILIQASDTVVVYAGEGGATYATPIYIGTGPDPTSLLVANLHGQLATAGVPDIVAPDANQGVMVLINVTR